MFAASAGVVVAAFDWVYLRPANPLVFATVLLGEGTAFLAVASFYSGYQQRQTNVRLEGIVARWLETEIAQNPPTSLPGKEPNPPK